MVHTYYNTNIIHKYYNTNIVHTYSKWPWCLLEILHIHIPCDGLQEQATVNVKNSSVLE